MNNNKGKIFMLSTSLISMVILMISGTFSFFSIEAKSKAGAVSAEAYRINIGLAITPLYSGNKLIPTNDSDIMKAYKNECVDKYGNGACNAYNISISNSYKKLDIIGKIDFTVDKIKNLSYMLLDENDNIYLDITKIDQNNSLNLPMGNNFVLEEASLENPSTRNFKLVVWLTNLPVPQEDDDAGGSYTANITYSAVGGSKLSGSVNGFEDVNNNHDVSDLGGL